MENSVLEIQLASVCLMVLLLGNAIAEESPVVVPVPQKTNCSTSELEFKTWFATGNVTENGVVNAADSAHFPANNTACDFYKWASQMFLWLTSPSNESDAGPYVFDSSTFFDVSPEITEGGKTYRTLISNVSSSNAYSVRSTKPEEIGEVDQAGGQHEGLIAQSAGLLYYGIHVNDLYAYFLTGQPVEEKYNKTHTQKLPVSNNFPTTKVEADEIALFALSQGV